MCQTSVKLTPGCINTRQGPSGTKVPRLDMCSSIISLSKIVYQIWHDHPISQRNKTTERTVGVGVGSDRDIGTGGAWRKFEKRGGGGQGRQ